MSLHGVGAVAAAEDSHACNCATVDVYAYVAFDGRACACAAENSRTLQISSRYISAVDFNRRVSLDERIFRRRPVEAVRPTADVYDITAVENKRSVADNRRASLAAAVEIFLAVVCRREVERASVDCKRSPSAIHVGFGCIDGIRISSPLDWCGARNRPPTSRPQRERVLTM